MIGLVLPTYNESKNIEPLLEQTARFLRGRDFFVVVIDDNSTDGTIEVVRRLQGGYDLSLVVRPSKLGLGSALKEGIQLALAKHADKVITIDADLSHDPAMLPEILSASESADLVLGSRYASGGSFDSSLYRVFISKKGNQLARKLLKLSVRDLTTGYRCYDAGLLRNVDWQQVKSNNYNFAVEILFHLAAIGAKITEVPIKFSKRSYGKSKFGVAEIARSFFMLCRIAAKARFPK